MSDQKTPGWWRVHHRIPLDGSGAGSMRAWFIATNGLEISSDGEGGLVVEGPFEEEARLSAAVLEAVLQWHELRSIGGA